MGLFSKAARTESIDGSWIRVGALVIAADAPPQGAPSRGAHSRGTIQVLVEAPNIGRRKLSAPLRYAETHWLAAGMEVPVAIDPAHPDTFEVDWPAVPTMQQQAEANHPALADPFAASRRIAAAIGITPSVKTAAHLERFQAAVAEAGTKSAPPGRLRAVAMTVTIRGRFYSGDNGDGTSSGSGVSYTMNSAAVLSVAMPGQLPYAVYVPRFKFARKHLVIPAEPMPALVAAGDPRDVEIRWDEMPGLGDQIAARMADSARRNSDLLAGLSEQYRAATAQAMAAPQPGAPPPGTPPPGALPPAALPPAAGMPPQARQMIIDNLKRSLLYVTDPAQRQLVLDQYRAMGIDITAAELGF